MSNIDAPTEERLSGVVVSIPACGVPAHFKAFPAKIKLPVITPPSAILERAQKIQSQMQSSWAREGEGSRVANNVRMLTPFTSANCYF
jgi:hypothetical protein